MAEERNALAELADWLESQEDCFPVLANQFLWQDKRDIENIKKIHRIIAELAKASDAIGCADEFAKDGFKDCIYIPATQQLCVKKILKCREIAAEE